MQMNKTTFYLLILAALFTACFAHQPNETTESRAQDFNFNWKFHLGDLENAHLAQYDDKDWRKVNLPHDWSVEHPFDSIDGEGATGYLPGGIGWYRKEFVIEDINKVVYINFDGIYNRSTVYVNGQEVGFHPYGYSPILYDISSYLQEGSNVVSVRVDHSRYADSRWYTGSGIYRDVKLIKTNKLHVPLWGTYMTTPKVSEEEATVVTEVTIRNAFEKPQNAELILSIKDPQGNQVVQKRQSITIAAGSDQKVDIEALVPAPRLWEVDDPVMYEAVVSITQNGQQIDRYTTPFGIRTFDFDPDKGFTWNGKNQKIKGVCLHHDAGIVGAAVPDGVWRRRLEKLKEAGVNAIRISHNPGSQAFMDLCDEMGFYVQVEFYDEWDNPKDKRFNMNEKKSKDYITRGHHEFFQEWAERDLKTVMLRDRNHPSVFQWSIGNEIEWTYPRYKNATGYFGMNWQGNYFWELPPITPEEIKARFDASEPGKYVLAETAQKLANWTREMDTTRPVIANCILPSASHVTGYADALDIVGYSYRRVLYDYGHQNYPDKPIMGTENLGQWHEWKAVLERPFISGTFLWTGIDYMGESNNQWPRKATPSGILDVAGFEKPRFHMFKTLWNESEAHTYIATQEVDQSIYQIDESTGELTERKKDRWKRALWGWHDVNEHWNYQEGDLITVEVYSSAEEVELFLNDKSLGVKSLADFEDRIYKWAVPYAAGELKAVGKSSEAVLFTADAPIAIQVKLDKQRIAADGYDVVHLVAQLVDSKGNPVKHQETEIHFEVSGPVTLLGVDNGSPANVQPFQAESLVTANGKALAILQATRETGEVSVTVSGKGLRSETVTLSVD